MAAFDSAASAPSREQDQREGFVRDDVFLSGPPAQTLADILTKQTRHSNDNRVSIEIMDREVVGMVDDGRKQ